MGGDVNILATSDDIFTEVADLNKNLGVTANSGQLSPHFWGGALILCFKILHRN